MSSGVCVARIPAPIPCEVPVTMPVLRGPCMVVCLELVLSPGRIRRSSGSEIRIQHDAVAGLARFKPGEGLVDIAHREVLVLRRDVVPRSEVEHRRDRRRRAARRARDAPLLQDERERRDRNGFE